MMVYSYSVDGAVGKHSYIDCLLGTMRVDG